MTDGHDSYAGGWRGPRSWAVSVALGGAVGAVAGVLAPVVERADHAPAIPLLLCLPFVLLLLSIATMPFISDRVWHRHYPDFAFALGAIAVSYYLVAFGEYGRHAVLHAAAEYYSFIALVGGLYIVSGGILVGVGARGRPAANTALLAFGAVLANIVGTTGASVLLIRPFMRMNHGRLRAIHIVMFIFIVSNCGGCLTPIGDPPLYLGFLKGVPFFWTLQHLWPMWLACNGTLLGIFYVIDRGIGRRLPRVEDEAVDALEPRPVPHAIRGFDIGPVRIAGGWAIVCLALLVAGVFIDPVLAATAGIHGIPVGATVQMGIAIAGYRLARREIHEANHFNFHPVKEVGLLFIGIFATMMPALGYLAANASRLGLDSPTEFYFATGMLSATLDNAPTYLSFLQVAFGVMGLEITPENMRMFIAGTHQMGHNGGVSGARVLEAISLGAVLFGAMTYIGNGPNFMVKSIADSFGVKMPSFFGYLGLSVVILGPVLVMVWGVFLR